MVPPTDSNRTSPCPRMSLKMLAAAGAPGVAIETLAAIFDHAIGMHDVAVRREQPLDDVRWIFDDVGIEPEDPILVAKRAE